MSFKNEIGDYVSYLVRNESFEVDVYNLELDYTNNSVDIEIKGYVDIDGDLCINATLSEYEVLNLIGGIDVLNHFTEEEIKCYLEEHYGE